jgi:hypothetical protein
MQNHEEESHKDTTMRDEEQRKEKVVESENNQLREKMQKINSSIHPSICRAR